MAKHGINHQLLEGSDPNFYAKWWDSVSKWASFIRLDTHMDALAWRVDPYYVYPDKGTDGLQAFRDITLRCVTAGIGIHLIRDGFPSSPHWKALGGDWSSFLTGNWRHYSVPSQAWSKVNAFVTAIAKIVNDKRIEVIWQGPNEQLNRGKDQHSYARMKSVYTTASYGRPWTSPAIWGRQNKVDHSDAPLLLEAIYEWLAMAKYDKALNKATQLAVNIYPDWDRSMALYLDSLLRLIQNLVAVHDISCEFNLPLHVTEWGFATNQTAPADRVKYTKLIMAVIDQLPNIKTAALFWDAGDYYLSPEQLTELATAPAPDPILVKELIAKAEQSEFVTTNREHLNRLRAVEVPQ